MKPKIVVIVGPTAVGKTSFSILAAKKFNGEIVNADSVQLYRGLNIGSAKVTQDEMQNVRHHLIDTLDPTENYNASDYTIAARKCISDILSRGKLPIIVGGTGMYVNALLFGLSVNEGSDPEYRKELEALAQEKGGAYLHKELEKIDPESAKLIHPNHVSRIIRALEIYHVSGIKKSQYKQSNESDYDYLLLGLTLPRNELYERINKRVDIMLSEGLINEVEQLKKQGLTKQHKSMSAIGYKQTLDYLDGQDYLIYVEKLKQASRNYAKRQETFFKKMRGIVMVNAKDTTKNLKLIEDFING